MRRPEQFVVVVGGRPVVHRRLAHVQVGAEGGEAFVALSSLKDSARNGDTPEVVVRVRSEPGEVLVRDFPAVGPKELQPGLGHGSEHVVAGREKPEIVGNINKVQEGLALDVDAATSAHRELAELGSGHVKGSVEDYRG